MLKVHKKITENEYLLDFKEAYVASALPPKSASEPHICFFYIEQTAQSFFSALDTRGRVQSTKSGTCLKQVLSDENRSFV